MLASHNRQNTLVLQFKDNTEAQKLPVGSAPIKDEHLKLLEYYSDRSLSEFCEMGAAYFDSPNAELSDGDTQTVFHLSRDRNGVSVTTFNIMGSIRLKHKDAHHEVLLEITSRFDHDPRQFFLTYLLSKALGFRVIEEQDNPANTESLWIFLMALMFKQGLVRASAVGLYKKYRMYEGNDLKFRGKFQLNRHLRVNVPIGGAIAYSTGEYSFDNSINHLFRHALHKIRRDWPWLLANDRALHSIRFQLEQNTPSWEQFRVSQDIRSEDCGRQIRHPYFASHYEPLRRLALALLQDNGASQHHTVSTTVDGILFDGAWLWEEYLFAIFKENNIELEHPRNRAKKGTIWVFSEPRSTPRYPDFYSAKWHVVLDAKYKKLNPSSIGVDDLNQLITYMHILKAYSGALIFPHMGSGARSTPLGVLNGFGGKVALIGLLIPKSSGQASNFVTEMAKSEKAFCADTRLMFAA